MGEFLTEILRSYGLPFFIVAAVLILLLWGIAHWAAAPGEQVSVLWGMVKYTKPERVKKLPQVDKSSEPPRQRGAAAPRPDGVLPAIRGEGPELLAVVRAEAAGLWLAAEAVTSDRAAVLKAAQPIKPQYQAEALARATEALGVLGRSDDARMLAARSLTALEDVPDTLHRYTLVTMMEKFHAAGLDKESLEAAGRALPLALAAKPADEMGLARLARFFASCDSFGRGLNMARAIPNAQGRCKALSELATLLLDQQRAAEAVNVLQEALKAAQSIGDAMERARALSDLTMQFARAGRYDESTRLAKMAHEAAVQIDPRVMFGELTTKIIVSDMQFFEIPPGQVLAQAELHHQPRVLLKLARSLPRHSDEYQRAMQGAQRFGREGRMADVLVEAGELQSKAGSMEEAADSGRRAAALALSASDERTRDSVLPRAAQLLASHGDFAAAMQAAAGVSGPRWAAEAIAKVLGACYAHRGEPGDRAAAAIERTWSAARRLEDRDRSTAAMFLGASQAFIGCPEDAYLIAREAPSTGNRLAAYAAVALVDGVKNLPAAVEHKIRGAGGDALVSILSPVFDWSIAS